MGLVDLHFNFRNNCDSCTTELKIRAPTGDIANGQTAYLMLPCNSTVKLPILLDFVLLATFIFLDLDLQNAVLHSCRCRCWAVSLFYCFLQTDVATRHI